MTIESSRFGRVEIDPERIVEFPDGLIGLGGSRYALLASDEESPFLWLHSLEDPDLALPVTDPARFYASFRVELADEDAERLGLDDITAVAIYVTVRAAATLEDFRANLKAPILVWNGQGHQVINQAGDCSLQAPLFASTAPASDPA